MPSRCSCGSAAQGPFATIILCTGFLTKKAREEIFRIHMKKRGIDPSGIDFSLLASSPKRLSGAEIEQVVNSAAFEALAEKRPVVEQDFLWP